MAKKNLDNYDLRIKKPLDIRSSVENLADVELPYEGLWTFQKSDGKHYKYVGGQWIYFNKEADDKIVIVDGKITSVDVKTDSVITSQQNLIGNISSLIGQYMFSKTHIKAKYGVDLVIDSSANITQTRDNTYPFAPVILKDTINRIEFKVIDTDIWFMMGGLYNQFTMVSITGGGTGTIFNDNAQINTQLSSATPSYHPVKYDVLAIERHSDGFVFYVKNGVGVFAPYMTIMDSDYPTAYHVTNSIFNMGFILFASNNLSDGYVRELMVNYTSDSAKALLSVSTNSNNNSIPPFYVKWNSIGDSITYRNIYQPLVKAYLQIGSYTNYGISGAMIADPNLNNNNSLSVSYITSDNTADLVTVFGGTNDFSYNVPLGTINDTTRVTFYGALRVLIEGLLNKNRKARIVFFTPLQRDFHIQGEAVGLVNSLGIHLRQYADAIIEMCELYAIPVLDLYRRSGITLKTLSYYTDDGLHPNNAFGQPLIARQMANFIKTT